MASTKGMIRIGSNERVFSEGGKLFITKKKRSRRRYKLPAKTRKKIATSAKKLKLPALTIAVNAPPLFQAIDSYNKTKDMRQAGNAILGAYTGIWINTDYSVNFNIKRAWATFANLALGIVKKTGVLKAPNQMLAKAKLPVRLS